MSPVRNEDFEGAEAALSLTMIFLCQAGVLRSSARGKELRLGDDKLVAKDPTGTDRLPGVCGFR